MVAPDVQIEDGKGTILISSEEGETEGRGDGGKTSLVALPSAMLLKQTLRFCTVASHNYVCHRFINQLSFTFWTFT